MLKTLRKEDRKLDQLCQAIESIGEMVVAFSGGVDSTFLIKIAHELLQEKALALTVSAPYIAKWEIEEAQDLTAKLGVKHAFIYADIDESIRFNPEDRCYLCKKKIFSEIKAFASACGFSVVCDGSNADDLGDYRPGMRALKELGIRSPLMENGITKEDIRHWSKVLNLETWDKPPYACLLTRLPYGTKVEPEALQMIEASERYLIEKGFRAVRVRKHEDMARIELDFSLSSHLLSFDTFREISKALKGMGFKYVTLDLEGYTMGSFNRGLLKTEVSND